MPCFMICSNLLFFLRDYFTLLLRSNTHFDKCLADISLADIHTILFCCCNRSFIHQILQIRSGKSCCRLCDLRQIHIITKRLALGMHLQDLFSSLYIRTSNTHFTVKSSRTQNCRIQNIHTVGRRHYDNAFVHTESVHLHQQLVQCLFTLIMTAAHTGTTSSCHRINLINENDTRCILLGFFKQISHS